MAGSIDDTLALANDYFLTRLFADAWNAASTDIRKAALITALNRLSSEYTFADPLEDIQAVALFDMALYLLQAGEGQERRIALQAAGVKRAGLVEETYDSEKATLIPAHIVKMLRPWKNTPGSVYVGVAPIYRDENC